MSEKDINRWNEATHPRALRPFPWDIRSGGSWDMAKIQPISDEMLAELMQRFHSAGTPWNCRSMPLSASDREYMYLLYFSMQGLVARLRLAEADIANLNALMDSASASDAKVREYAEKLAGMIRTFGENELRYVENNNGPDFKQCPGCGAGQEGRGYRSTWKANGEMEHDSDCLWAFARTALSKKPGESNAISNPAGQDLAEPSAHAEDSGPAGLGPTDGRAT